MFLHQYEAGTALWLARAELDALPRWDASRPRGVRAQLWGGIWGGT